MIKTLIFDFGDVFINLDKQGAMDNALNIFNLKIFENDMTAINKAYEVGDISTKRFIEFYLSKFPELNKKQIVDAWNYIIKDFPIHRLEFAQKLKQKSNYQLILLSNTNEMHIKFIKQNVSFYNDFKNCFDKFYLSHEINLRKPNANIYNYVVEENDLNPSECLFIDDTKENTDAAKKLGMQTWNIDETREDVVNLFSIKKELF